MRWRVHEADDPVHRTRCDAWVLRSVSAEKVTMDGAGPLLAKCTADKSAAPSWFDHFATTLNKGSAAAERLVRASLEEDATARAAWGGKAIRYLRRARALRPKSRRQERPEELVNEVRNLLAITSMCAWRRSALQYARELMAMPSCSSDTACYCEAAGRAVSLLRGTGANATSVEEFFQSVVHLCPYASSWQMPTPPQGFADWIALRPFWDPQEFAVGRLLRANRRALLDELRPFSARRHALWNTRGDAALNEQDPELVEAGWWRQLPLYREGHGGWNATICAQLPVTCALLRDHAATDEGRRELGGKIKLFVRARMPPGPTWAPPVPRGAACDDARAARTVSRACAGAGRPLVAAASLWADQHADLPPFCGPAAHRPLRRIMRGPRRRARRRRPGRERRR